MYKPITLLLLGKRQKLEEKNVLLCMNLNRCLAFKDNSNANLHYINKQIYELPEAARAPIIVPFILIGGCPAIPMGIFGS